MTLALSNLKRELPELTAAVLGGTREPEGQVTDPDYTAALQSLRLSNEAIWAREEARQQVPAPLVIKGPYLALCAVLDGLFDGRPIARFWFLETVARVPYFSYNTMIFAYETLGWWRRSAELKKVHFDEEWNEFHHLLIMESLGGDQAWFARFIAQHSAIVYYLLITLMWIVSPTLAYNFSELIEAHAVDTYAEFVDANEATLRSLPPPQTAVSFYESGERAAAVSSEHADPHAPHASAGSGSAGRIGSLYDVFCRVRDDEASHVDSMKGCQDGDVRARARIVELASIATAAAILATSAATVETAETVESISEPIVAKVERTVAEDLQAVEGKLDEGFNEAMREAEVGGNKWAPTPSAWKLFAPRG